MTIPLSEALRQQKRLAVLTVLLLVLQLFNTVLLWATTGRLYPWAAVATVGLAVFAYFSVARYRRLKALPSEPAAGAKRRKKRRLRDPHRRAK